MDKIGFTDSMSVRRTAIVLETSPTGSHIKVEVIINGHPWIDWIPAHRVV